MTLSVKLTANSTYQKIADGPATLYLQPVIRTSTLVIKETDTIPDSDYSNNFIMKSGVMDGTLTIHVSNGSFAFVKAISETSVFSYIVDQDS